MIRSIIYLAFGCSIVFTESIINHFFYYVGGIANNTMIQISGMFSHTFIIGSLFGAFLIGYGLKGIVSDILLKQKG